MLQDFVIELAVKHKRERKQKILIALSIVILVFLILMINIIPIALNLNIIYITGIISFFICYGFYILIRRTDFEFEISLVNDTLSIAKIIAQRSRKEIIEFNIRKAECIAPITDERFNEYQKNAVFVFHCVDNSIGIVPSNRWFIAINDEGCHYIVVIDIVENMYKAFRRFNPRNTMIVKNEEF